MKISLLTDAPKHNLALMKLSAWHKAIGDEVCLNMPLNKTNKTYASVLFEWNKKKFFADEYGGPAFENSSLCQSIQNCKPDYSLFQLDYSLGYTYRYCPRHCAFCKVSVFNHPDISHHSIWDFHLPTYKRICLLNNNTFADPKWKETFEEIWNDNLTVIDENGYDLRLIDEEKAEVLRKTKWDDSNAPHFAWDRMEDESQIIKGIEEINRVGFKHKSIYVLIGYNTTIEQDIYRFQKIHDLGHNPFPMIYKETSVLKSLRRMIYQRYYRQSGNIEKAWKEYRMG